MNFRNYLSKLLIFITVLACSCTSVASVKWVQRVGGDKRKKVWIPTCSKCGHVVNYRARQCSNPEDRTLIVWNDKDLYFEFPDNPQSDYTSEQLEIIDPREQSDEVIVTNEQEDAVPEGSDGVDETQEETVPQTGVTSDFDDLDWEEDDWEDDDWSEGSSEEDSLEDEGYGEEDDYKEDELVEEPSSTDTGDSVRDDSFDAWEDSEEIDKFLEEEPLDSGSENEVVSEEETTDESTNAGFGSWEDESENTENAKDKTKKEEKDTDTSTDSGEEDSSDDAWGDWGDF